MQLNDLNLLINYVSISIQNVTALNSSLSLSLSLYSTYMYKVRRLLSTVTDSFGALWNELSCGLIVLRDVMNAQ